MSVRPVTNECPYCQGALQCDRMACRQCGVAIEADFPRSRLADLPTEHQRFIEMFVLAGGNLKEIAEQTGVSYPTVRSRLNKIIDALRLEIAKTVPSSGSILDAVVEADAIDNRRRAGAPHVAPEVAGRLIKSI